VSAAIDPHKWPLVRLTGIKAWQNLEPLGFLRRRLPVRLPNEGEGAGVLIGRVYRKTISQGVAFIAFRWIAIWLLVGACVANGKPAGTTGALVIIAVDIIAHSSLRGLSFSAAHQERKQWTDTLTNRTFYKLFWEELRGTGPTGINIEELFSRAAKEAVADVQKADKDSKLDNGWLDSTPWHWFGGVLSFLGQIVGYCLYYGSAFLVFGK
jgi:hypothetical protein